MVVILVEICFHVCQQMVVPIEGQDLVRIDRYFYPACAVKTADIHERELTFTHSLILLRTLRICLLSAAHRVITGANKAMLHALG